MTNFSATTDFLDFNVRAWNHNDAKNGVFGLSATQAGAATPANTDALGLASTFGTAMTFQQVANGGTMKPGAGAADFFVLSEGNFLNAQAVATALDTGTYKVTVGPLTANADYDFLIAYAGTDGNAHIADLHIQEGKATGLVEDQAVVAVSDIVTLVGTTVNTLVANASHVHLSNAQII